MWERVVRVPMELDRRRFVPVPRDSYKWRRLYGCRTAVERVNSRLDVSFGFERHFICGMAKMRFRVGLALVVMLAMAKGCPSNPLALRPGFQKTVAAQMAR